MGIPGVVKGRDGSELKHPGERLGELSGEREPGGSRAGEGAAVGHWATASVNELVSIETDDVDDRAFRVKARATGAFDGEAGAYRRESANELRGASVKNRDVTAV